MSQFIEALKVAFEVLIWSAFVLLLGAYYILDKKIKAEDEDYERKQKCEKELEELDYFFRTEFSDSITDEEKNYFRNDWF